MTRILGIETSCDETSAAVVEHRDGTFALRFAVGASAARAEGLDHGAARAADAEQIDRMAAADLAHLETDSFKQMIETAAAAYPNFRVIGTTLRTVHSATINDWGALAWSRETGVVEATHRPKLEIMDRVGGGDSFASGLIYGLLEGADLTTAVNYGAAHGALAMTTPGDTTMVTKAEVLKLAGGGSARVDR